MGRAGGPRRARGRCREGALVALVREASDDTIDEVIHVVDFCVAGNDAVFYDNLPVLVENRTDEWRALVSAEPLLGGGYRGLGVVTNGRSVRGKHERIRARLVADPVV